MDDFIFGTLATDALRRERVQGQRAGVSHLSRRAPVDPLPGQPVRLLLSVGPRWGCQQAFAYWTADGSDPQGAKGVAANGSVQLCELVRSEWDTELWGYIRYYQAELPGLPEGSLLRYRLSVLCWDGQEVFADNGAYHALYIADDPAPTWSQAAVVYQVFVDRFNPGDGKAWETPDSPAGFYGGTLRGITEKLVHIASLGFNTLWLTPIFPSPSHHGYDASDLFAVEPRLGNLDDFSRLVEAAHRRNMRLLLDFVPNHVSDRHPAFQSAVQDRNSPYRDWFTFQHWPDQYETFFGVRELPQLNLRNPAARQHVLDAAAFWLENGADGFRVDYAIGPSPDFWAAFRQATRRVKADCWTFGEIVDPPDVQVAFAGQLDGALDFMLLEALRQTFAFGRWPAERLAAFLEGHTTFFPAEFSRPSFLDNHDMNRFLWAAGNDERRLRLAAFCQFTLAGPPVVYYGTEVGLSQQRDVRQGELGLPEESRLPMLWGGQQNSGLSEFYRQLIQMRRDNPAFSSQAMRILQAQGERLVYLRGEPGEQWLAALNLGQQPLVLRLGGEAGQDMFATNPGCRRHAFTGGVELQLPALAGIAFPWRGAEHTALQRDPAGTY